MKKPIALLLIVLMIAAFASCGGKSGQSGNSGDKPASTDHTHTYGEWTVTKEANCQTEGVIERVCSTCGQTEKQTYTSSVHDIENGVCKICGVRFSEGLEFTSNGDGTCSVTGIGSCTDLDLVIPSVSPEGDRVIKISEYAFRHTQITSLVIPDTVTEIDTAFYGCDMLHSVTIPASLRILNEYAFCDLNGCEYHIKDLAAFCCIELSCTEVYQSPFGYSPKFYVNGDLVTDLVIPDGTPEVKGFLFSYDDDLESVTIPGSAETVGKQAFKSCKNLKTVNMLNGVRTVDGEAFADCSSLENLYIPDSIEHIDASALYYDELLHFNDYDNARYLGNENNKYVYLYSALSTSITSCTVPTGTRIIGRGAFYDMMPGASLGARCKLESIVIPEGVVDIDDYAFLYCDKLESISLPDSLIRVGLRAIENYGKLALYEDNGGFYLGSDKNKHAVLYAAVRRTDGTFTLNKDTKVILSNAFSDCYFTQVILPDGLRYISDYGFSRCYELTSIVIPESVTAINYDVFEDCTALKEITLPATLTYLDTVYMGRNLETIRFLGTEEQWKKLGASESDSITVIISGKSDPSGPEAGDTNCKHSFGTWTFVSKDEQNVITLKRVCGKCGKTETVTAK